MAQFERYVGIDYSGAETPDSSCKGLRGYLVEGSSTPEPVQPPPSPRRYWTRRGLAEWLCEKLGDETPTIVGIDHAFLALPILSDEVVISQFLSLLQPPWHRVPLHQEQARTAA